MLDYQYDKDRISIFWVCHRGFLCVGHLRGIFQGADLRFGFANTRSTMAEDDIYPDLLFHAVGPMFDCRCLVYI